MLGENAQFPEEQMRLEPGSSRSHVWVLSEYL